MNDELQVQDQDDIDMSINIASAIEKQIIDGEIITDDLIALENLKPGIITDIVRSTKRLSESDKELALEALMDYKKLLAGGIIGAIIAFLIKLLLGGDDSSAKEKTPEKVQHIIVEAGKAQEEAVDAANEARHDPSKHSELADKVKTEIVNKIVARTHKTEAEAKVIVNNDNSIRAYLFDSSKFIKDATLKDLRGKVIHILSSSSFGTEQKNLYNFLVSMHPHAEKRKNNLVATIREMASTSKGDGPGGLRTAEKYIPQVYTDDISTISAFIGETIDINDDTDYKHVGIMLENKVKEYLALTPDNVLASYSDVPDISKWFDTHLCAAVELASQYTDVYAKDLKYIQEQSEDFIQTRITPNEQGRYRRDVMTNNYTELHSMVTKNYKRIDNQYSLMKSILACMKLITNRMVGLLDVLQSHAKHMVEVKHFILRIQQIYDLPSTI